MIIGIPESNLVLVRILVRPALLAGREKGGTMRKLVSCEFNIDTACVELRYAGRSRLEQHMKQQTGSFAGLLLFSVLRV